MPRSNTATAENTETTTESKPVVDQAALQDLLTTLVKKVDRMENDRAAKAQRAVQGPKAHAFGCYGIYREKAAELAEAAASQDDRIVAAIMDLGAMIHELLEFQMWVYKDRNAAKFNEKNATAARMQQLETELAALKS